MAIADNCENIFMWNSQEVESFFRLLRSYTGIESTIVNCSIKNFVSRVQKIQLEENLMRVLSQQHGLQFPKIVSRKNVSQKPKSHFSIEKIHSIIESGSHLDTNDASLLGMVCAVVSPELFLKATAAVAEEPHADQHDCADQRENDFFGENAGKCTCCVIFEKYLE